MKQLYQQYQMPGALKGSQKIKSCRNQPTKHLQKSSCSHSKAPTTHSKITHKRIQKQQLNKVISEIDRLTNKIKSLSHCNSRKKTTKKNKHQQNQTTFKTHKIFTQQSQFYQKQLEHYKQYLMKNWRGSNDRQVYSRKSQDNSKYKKVDQKSECSSNCHLAMKEICGLRLQNQRLIMEKSQLEKKLQRKQQQRKSLKKKIQQRNSHKVEQKGRKSHKGYYKTIDPSNTYLHPPQPNTFQTAQTQFTSEEQFYKSIKLQPYTIDLGTNKQQFSTQDPSINTKTPELSHQLQRSYLNLSKKNYLKPNSSLHGSKIKQRKNPQQDIETQCRQKSRQKQRQRQSDETIKNLQKYFDTLVEASRLQRNITKKKAIRNEMKQLASRIKELKKIHNFY